MNCEEFRESADALALGALAPEEARQARGHLAACAACAAAYAAAQAVAERLTLAVPLVSAPAGMRSAVLAAIGASPDSAVRPDPPAAAASVPRQVGTARRSAAARRTQLFGRRLALPAAAAVALVVIVGLALWVANLQGRIHKLEQEVRNPGAPAAAPAVGSQTQHDAILLLSSPNTVSARLWAKPANPSADGAIIWNPTKQRCIVFASKLKPLGAGQEYHIYFRVGDNRWDGGTLTADAAGAAEADFATDRWQLGVGYTVTVVVQPSSQGGASEPVLEGAVQAPAQ